MTISFREAIPHDADALGALHVATWRESYKGLLPDSLLDGISAAARSAMWRKLLGDPAGPDGTSVFLAESDGRMIGFGACGGQRDDALGGKGFDGEFGAIYVLVTHQHAGVGKALFGLMARKLLDQGRSVATLWVLRENIPARNFYEALGGTVVGEKTEAESGTAITEVAYGWRDLSLLQK